MIVATNISGIVAAEQVLNNRLRKYGYNCIVDTNVERYFVNIGNIIRGLYLASGKEPPNVITHPFNQAVIVANNLLDNLEQ